MRKHKVSEQLAQQLERESEDAELWTQEPTHIEARPTRTSVLSLRLPTAEFRALLQAAQDAGESVSAYVRTAIMMRRAVQQAPASITVSYTHDGMPNKVELDQWASWTASAQEISLTVTR